MKKILFILGLAFVVSVPVYAAPIPDAGFDNVVKKVNVGYNSKSAVRELRLVRFAEQAQNGASLLSGDLVVWDVLSDDGVTIDTTTTSADGALAGIVATTIQTSDTTQNSLAEAAGGRNWGWIVVSGPMVVDINDGDNDATVGDFFITSTDATVATTIVNRAGGIVLVDVQERGLYEVAANGGFFLDTPTAGDTSAEVYVQLQ